MVKPIKANKIAKALTNKGFKEISSKHRKFILYIDGKKQRIFTVISHGAKEIPKNLVKTMIKQLKFKNYDQFQDFVECPMTFEDYIKYLKDEGYIQ